ncbi:MAG: hypothetical protein FWH01_09425 [Oscillospiraceae bacterium]|nr:hypothetical protein [Oscillospiraceae bacterium]
MDIQAQRQLLFDKDESNGYIERESAIDEFLKTMPPEDPSAAASRRPLAGRSEQVKLIRTTRRPAPPDQAERYVAALEYMLERLSTPVEPFDVLVGRMVEGPLPYELEGIPAGGRSHAFNPFRPNSRNGGHMSLDFGVLLKKGLRGIAEDAMDTAISGAASVGGAAGAAVTAPQRQYAALLLRAAEAIDKWSQRWSAAAAAAGNERAAKALAVVPAGPAYDFFSAVQSVWMVEMILSCVTGGRDFAYSRLDMALAPYFDEAESEEALEILTSFFMKNNEIGGLSSELNNPMPVPCAATNIYLMLGGRGADGALPLSLLFLKAAKAVMLPQPVVALRLEKDSPRQWKLACMDAAQSLNGQAALYNDDVLIPGLIDLGYTEEQALHYTMSGCNRAEFVGHQSADYFHNCAQWLLDAFNDENVDDMDDLLEALGREARAGAAQCAGNERAPADGELRFCLESMLLDGCMEKVCDLENGGQSIETVVHNLVGLGTVADSLAAIDVLVFGERSITLPQYRELVKGNYAADPALRTRIALRLPKYGNDDQAADKWAAIAGEIIAKAVRGMRGDNIIHIPSFYSLFYHKNMGERMGATPDGRIGGEPLNENQSPGYGRDTEGITALLRSAASLPQRLCGAGGLNIRFARKLEDVLLLGLTETYFAMGGINLAVNIVSRETLEDARANPEHYRGLMVRVVGYSDVYLNLPEYLQLELLARTEIAAK